MIEAVVMIFLLVALVTLLPIADIWDSLKLLVDRSSRPKFRYSSPRGRSDYPAVSIRVTKDCCEAARQTRGKRYLSSEAPILPLAACTKHACRCTYAHHSERRSGTPRRRPMLELTDNPLDAGASDTTAQVNQRHSKGRRSHDLRSA